MNLLNILRTAHEIRSASLSINPESHQIANFSSMSFILESVQQECDLIELKTALRLLAVFKDQYSELINSKDEDEIDIARRLILEPEKAIKSMIEKWS